jgi:hypothetical protein
MNWEAIEEIQAARDLLEYLRTVCPEAKAISILLSSLDKKEKEVANGYADALNTSNPR